MQQDKHLANSCRSLGRIVSDILPILMLTDSIFKCTSPIAGVEIIAIPGLTAATLMFNFMQPRFRSGLKLEGRGAVIIHVGTNDLLAHHLNNVANCILHILYMIITAGPFAVFSNILPRPRDHRKTDSHRRFLNDTVFNYFKIDHYLTVWRTYRDFRYPDSPKEDIFNAVYISSGDEDNIPLKFAWPNSFEKLNL